ncbi:hypothetical protein A4A49_51241 [Nicotiana attenuata]|uniref:Uncharacterized protein n=1 Tax=Nicotiana attenuata TaxID=49451 RepID=A0A314LCV8_NICAT|nr:hypothetical protein A4A49_51241 [Nicotiana attenuata]
MQVVVVIPSLDHNITDEEQVFELVKQVREGIKNANSEFVNDDNHLSSIKEKANEQRKADFGWGQPIWVKAALKNG